MNINRYEENAYNVINRHENMQDKVSQFKSIVTIHVSR